MATNNQAAFPGATDTGLPLGKVEFRRLVEDYLGQMESDAEMTTQNYVTMTRLWNTIETCGLDASDPLYRRYCAAFSPAYIERIAKSLNAVPTKGMALYSKDYDIYLGGNPHRNSQYRLIEKI